MIAEVDAFEGLGDSVIDLAGVGSPVGNARQCEGAALGNRLVVGIHHQVELIRVRAVGEAGLDDLGLVDAAGEEDCQRGRGLGELGGGVDADAVGEDDVGLALGAGRQRERLPGDIRIGLAHEVDHPAALIGHAGQLLANGLTAPACADVGCRRQRA